MMFRDEPTSDYDDQMQGIEAGVLTYEQTHCKHGAFIGWWGGPDYMCFHCEMGTTDEEYAEILAERERERQRRARLPRYLAVIRRLTSRYEAMEAGPEKERYLARIERFVQAALKR